jgi:hypothetical protein
MRYLTASEVLVGSRTRVKCLGTSEATRSILAQLAASNDRTVDVVYP